MLNFVIWTPLLGALLLLTIPQKQNLWIKRIALMTVSLTFLFSLHLVCYFKSSSGYQFEIFRPWIPAIGAYYALGVDGFSLWLVLLATLLMPIAVLFSMGSIKEKEKSFYFNLLILETAMLGTLCALDVFLFYLFWEAMLIPMYFLIGIFGHGRKVYAAIKFFIFTLIGSVLMLLAIVYLRQEAEGSFLLDHWSLLALSPQVQGVLFAAFALAFAIKVPLFPLHTWLPDAHTEAPTAGSMILAGVLLKMGTYGFVRFAIPLFPDALLVAKPWIATLAVVGIVYGALVAMVQKDMKRLVAYSSISHLGFVMLGLMALTPQAVTGATYQMVNHGLTSAGLFLMVGMLYDRTHTRLIADYGGIAKQVPLYTFVFLILTFASIALPGTNSFVGEFLILSGSLKELPYQTILATLGVIFGAVYMLWMVERVFFGPLKKDSLKGLKDMNWREVLCVLPIILLVVWMGVKPNFFLSKIEIATQTLTETVQQNQLAKQSLKLQK
ncbi:MAG: NADH-quinone oxidoreductase subunit M [Deltaproteobacteria bacterium]|nr:NADH-quinone oxidoreductase subunit M [Deltaproteobacteria bacterium]